MIASLPMYDHPALRGATDRYWQAIRTALGEGPSELTREPDLWAQWRARDLLISQTCGYPYRARLHGQVQLVGTPDYGLPGCGAGEYNSVFAVRTDDSRNTLAEFQGATFAYNEAMSQSGWAAPMLHARDSGVCFGRFIKTGGHAFSAQAVATGKADIAGLDALSWKLMQAHDAFAKGLKVIAVTPPTPVLPYITSRTTNIARLRTAMTEAITALSQDDRDALSLHGIVEIGSDRYLAVASPPPPPNSV